ncbi:fibroblast growth factor receptor 4-like isoform X2 [Paramacrobiotus metropolitanus]|uniref:fibroblast growth factor receptor 4-like isoform X2 n=1 Tax=Paramacrobiotus metropolitanus TaxID=2943436 RepID=UPI002445AF3D|nr:fibroblast growth factor receptor 4-like isoform X2 [Paramacrobiotus metropolitanus]
MEIAFLLSREASVWIICLAMIITLAECHKLEAETMDNKIAEMFVREGEPFTLTTRGFIHPVQWYIHGKELSLWRQSNQQEYLALNVSTKWNSATGENFLHVVNAIPKIHSGNYSCNRPNHYPDGVAKRISVIVKVRSVKEEAMAKNTRMAAFAASAIWSTKRPASLSFISMDSVGEISYDYYSNSIVPRPQSAPRGTRFTMSCAPEGHPQYPSVHWDKDGRNLREWKNARVHLSDKDSLLSIDNVTCSDMGNYTCKVNTSRGFLYETRQLTVLLGFSRETEIDQHPTCEKDPSVNSSTYVVVGRNGQLRCSQMAGHADFYTKRKWEKRTVNPSPNCTHPGPIYHTVQDWRFGMSGEFFDIQDATPEHAGVYRCVANETGQTSSPVRLPHELLYCLIVLPATESASAWTLPVIFALLTVLVVVLGAFLVRFVYRRIKRSPRQHVVVGPVRTMVENRDYLPVCPDTPVSIRVSEETSETSKESDSDSDQSHEKEELLSEQTNPTTRVRVKYGRFNSQVDVHPGTDLWIAPEDVLLTQKQLGRGAHSVVWEAIVKSAGHQAVEAAAKHLKDNEAEEQDLLDIIKECRLMQTINSHENILKYLGFTIIRKKFCLLTEYASNGNLKSYLRQHQNDVNLWNYEKPLNQDSISADDLLNFSWQIAKGMNYLSEIKRVVHRDLAARNVLVNGQKILKISDFGLSRPVVERDYYRWQHQRKLPVKWMAPESLSQPIYTFKSDVWSFGIVLWEIATFGEEPYLSLFSEGNIVAESGADMVNILSNHTRLPQPPHCSPEMYSVMQSCWLYDASMRPTFTELEQQFHTLCNKDSHGHAYALLNGEAAGRSATSNQEYVEIVRTS